MRQKQVRRWKRSDNQRVAVVFVGFIRCGHCDGELTLIGGASVHVDPETSCIAFGGRAPSVGENEPKRSELGEFWATWFDAVREHATVDVVHATTKLVIAEREIAVRDPNQETIKALREALTAIAESPHQQYVCETDSDGQYAMGVADGHRCAANMARAALGLK